MHLPPTTGPDDADHSRWNRTCEAVSALQGLRVVERFYQALGFELVLDADVAIFKAGVGGFILQRYDVKEWAEDCMMQVMVHDLDAWWSHIESLNIPATFGVSWPLRPPAIQPWGLRVAYIADPSGVLWHVAQRPVP